ncbi:ead/Ea22-like family protein [Enterobacter roggenkampii]|uniref:ead/Ea22-like family protein n=1 Tax=Enterobacter roggenkampii TaxID=1812935 RepID=UPI00202247A4|nr:ead/Ea22-like family protein [Enterobacter roggenkampii]MCL8152842.1 ead/Ea22-like family protein [Enterobacter roggenkampii]MCM7560298.1 ead/Ea22-like family protein [Enterobacter roggenkampii]
MSIDKQYLREVAKQATGAHERINAISADDIFDISLHHDGAQLDADITDLNSFNEAANPATVLALLDELEAAEERYEDTLRQARSFREAHDSASELIRKMERNKPTVKLPTTRLWAGKIACYEESEVVAMLERAGINIAAAGKGEAS